MVERTPYLAADVVILTEDGELVLVRRANPPFEGWWALPGGFVRYGERVEDAAIREAYEETGLRVRLLRLVGVYSDPERDPRAHVVSVAFLAVPEGGELRAASDAAEVRAFRELPEKIAFDHRRIIMDALRIARELGLKVSIEGEGEGD